MSKKAIKLDDVKELLLGEDLRRKNTASCSESTSALMMDSRKGNLNLRVENQNPQVNPSMQTEQRVLYVGIVTQRDTSRKTLQPQINSAKARR